jgi:5'-phosphate synthase pdxT subunit
LEDFAQKRTGDGMTHASNTAAGNDESLTIGVLALQGAYDAHAQTIRRLGATPRMVRLPRDLDGIDGLIMPGGESTTMLRFLEQRGFFDVLKEFTHSTPTFGTCAGAILLATDVTNPVQKSLEALDITVERNSYGRQIDSTIVESESALPGGPLEMVFIRAPRITRTGAGVEILATRGQDPVLVRGGHLLAATFHPELGHDSRIHQLFLDMVRDYKPKA